MLYRMAESMISDIKWEPAQAQLIPRRGQETFKCDDPDLE